MRNKLAICAFCLLGLGIAVYGFDAKEVPMTGNIAHGYRGDSVFTPSDEDIAVVVEAWGEPIPEYLELVGGPAEWGWAAMRYEVDEEALRFFGEFRNWRYRYKGEFLMFGGKTDLSAEEIFTDYHMSSIDTDAIIFSQSKGVPPMDYFRMRAKYVDQIEDKLDTSE